MPSVNWYSVFQMAFVFISFTTLSYAVLRKYTGKLGIALSVLILIGVSPDFYLHVAFTQVAGILSAIGIFLFALGNMERKRLYLFFGLSLMILAVIFRKEMFLLGMPTLCLVILICLFRERSIWKESLIVLFAFVAAYAGLNKINSLHYMGNEYEYYAAYQGPRSYFGDGAFYDAKSFVAELNDRKLNSRDFRYLRAWYFYDNNVFSLDSMRSLIGIAERHRYKPNYLKMPFAIVRNLSSNLLRGSVWCWAFLCFMLIFYSNKRNWWIPWASVGLISVSYTYLLLVNRVVNHVEVGIWAFAVVFVLFFVNNDDVASKKMTNLIQIIGLLSFACLIISGSYVAFDKLSTISKPKSGSVADWAVFSDFTKKHPNDVFLLPFGRYKEFATRINQVYRAVTPGSWNNIYSTGYWNIHFPPMDRELEKRGVKNIIRDVVRDNVYVVDDEDALSLIPYHSDHYHHRLEIDTLKHFGKIKLLKYRMGGVGDEITQH